MFFSRFFGAMQLFVEEMMHNEKLGSAKCNMNRYDGFLRQAERRAKLREAQPLDSLRMEMIQNEKQKINKRNFELNFESFPSAAC